MSGPLDDPRTQEGVEHLQAAARELIAAARSFLDVAEEAVSDPAALEAVTSLFGEAWRAATRSPAPAPEDEARPGGRVEHIPLQ